MAKFGVFLKSDLGKGLAIGLGIGAVGLVLVPALRPVAKSALKGGILLFEKGREWMAEASESLEDVVAEVRAELSGEPADGDSLEAAESEG